MRYGLGMNRVLLSTVLLCGCQGAQDAVSALLCGNGHAKGKMTVGLNLEFFKGLFGVRDGAGFTEQTVVSDDNLKGYINDALSGKLSEDLLSVKSVESLSDNDEFRFLEMGGTFGAGFGVATKLLSKNLGSNLTGESPFSFINESFSVAAADFRIVSGTASEEQWAYKQTDYSGSIDLIKALRDKENSSDDPVIVAVLDTGVDGGHPDLKDIMVKGADFSGSSTGSDDENGHGTHCAGIIAGQAKQSNGVLGVAGEVNVRIMPIKVLGKSGGGDFQAIEKGVRYAAENGADVISMSLGAGLEYSDLKKQSSSPLKNGIFQSAIDKGIIVVVAAGNEACPLGGSCKHQTGLFPKKFSEYTVVPCAYEGAICVGASDPDETLATYSNYTSGKSSSAFRTQADINAPGTGIYSTWPQTLGKDYNTISGTSMATPFVAGMAALFKAVDRKIDQEQFRKLLQRGATKPADIVEKSNVGRADLYATTVAFANDKGLSNVPAEATPQPKPVDGPGSGDNDGDIDLSDLWNAVCEQ